MPGDRIERPQGGGGGRGRGEGGDGESEDAFAFSLSREEFMQIFFDDLELPRLARNVVGRSAPVQAAARRLHHAGLADQPRGAPLPAQRARSTHRADGPARRELVEREAMVSEALARRSPGGEPTTGDGDESGDARIAELLAEVELLRRRIDRVPFLDEIDLRYRHRVPVPQPISQAVMFCLMDVSASMDEHQERTSPSGSSRCSTCSSRASTSASKSSSSATPTTPRRSTRSASFTNARAAERWCFRRSS